MSLFEIKNVLTSVEPSATDAGLRVPSANPGDAAEFAQLMEGLVLASASTRQPSITTQWMRAPIAAYGRVMELLERPAPAGMPVLQAMEFYAQKQIDLNEARTLQNVVATVAKLAKKNVETVLNNK